MNIQRAKEISESSEQANVSFQGMPVMIQHVDESNETARIYDAANPNRELTVPINSLEEI
ncbi:H-type small acid-soluble spore protein [Bacillus sp. DX1.1]|uniref:H-type small acid-soluble spore protein n=1 Tax=unclassified Bacillus (in: firmicutes) TaxID=185979 RepID=UPI0025708E25|nr:MULTISPECIES: H-type small acid-soluble spore protein [unclassified Bacillus (in: firmicutes)]MDM5154270.1 H-type small acid-soluble spore protein [Bacillus sp. DX1.1]MDM5187956.1 H-type small acid-soluble spore protein [Bacillus sp. DX4.1]WJE83188.1 H-type small acid-soluble spore protein [Bacillus sp. DX3.1]